MRDGGRHRAASDKVIGLSCGDGLDEAMAALADRLGRAMVEAAP